MTGTSKNKIKPLNRVQKDRVRQVFDGAVCHADGTVTVKDGYFYRPAGGLDGLESRVLSAFPGSEVIERGDRFREWPADSYLWVRFRPEFATD